MNAGPSAFSALRPLWRLLLAVLVLAGAWVFTDLFLRADLPGAAALAHLAFRAVSTPLRVLRTHSENPLLMLVVVGALLGSMAYRRPVVGALLWRIPALGLAVAELVLVALAFLLERSVAVGLVVALLAAIGLGLLRAKAKDASQEQRGRMPRLATTSMAIAGAVLSWLLLNSLYDTQASYSLLSLAGEGLRRGSWSPAAIYQGLLVTIVVVALVLLLRRWRNDYRRLGLYAAVLAAGLVSSLAFYSLSADPAPLWSVVLTTPAAVLLVLSSTFTLPEDLRRSWDIPPRWLGLLLPLLAPCLLMFGQTYAVRILSCPIASEIPGLERIALTTEVFRIALDGNGNQAVFSVRGSDKLLAIRLQPDISPPREIQPGPAGSEEDSDTSAVLLGSPEDLLFLPSTGGWLGALMPSEEDPHVRPIEERFPGGGTCEGAADFGSLLIEVDPSATRIERAFTIPGLCWVSSMHWDPIREEALLGWEYRAGFHRFNPVSRQWSSHELTDRTGDVIDFAQDPDPGSRDLFTVSLWKSGRLSRLDSQTSELTGSVAIGGTNYDIALDKARERLYVSSFYASRVRVVNSKTLELEGSIPTGFGTRALAVVPRMNLLLVSSIYDGTLRIWDLAEDRQLAELRVGGHVKNFAVDEKRGHALFWSQCGLYRLNLETLLESLRD